MIGNSNRRSGDFPAEGYGFGRIIYGLVVLFGRFGKSIIDQMKLIAMILAVSVVTENSAVAKAKRLSGLLANTYTGSNNSRAVTLGPLVRISKRLDSGAEIFC